MIGTFCKPQRTYTHVHVYTHTWNSLIFVNLKDIIGISPIDGEHFVMFKGNKLEAYDISNTPLCGLVLKASNQSYPKLLYRYQYVVHAFVLQKAAIKTANKPRGEGTCQKEDKIIQKY